jgi:hypothetical protein
MGKLVLSLSKANSFSGIRSRGEFKKGMCSLRRFRAIFVCLAMYMNLNCAVETKVHLAAP